MAKAGVAGAAGEKVKKTSAEAQEDQNSVRLSALRQGLDKIGLGEFAEKYPGVEMFLSDAPDELLVEKIPSGLLSLDSPLALDGGLPMGRLIECFGKTGSGKTTLGLQIMRGLLDRGIKCAFLDMERTSSSGYLKSLLGPHAKVTPGFRASSAEEGFALIRDLIARHGYRFVVVDSVAAFLPKAEVEEEKEANAMGLHARVMGSVTRRLLPLLSEHRATVFFINQTREDLSSHGGYGPRKRTMGGHALPYFASVRLELVPLARIRRGEEEQGIEVLFSFEKNKVNASCPRGKTVVHLYYGRGFDQVVDAIRWGERLGLVKRKGSWFEYGEEKLGQGLDRAHDTLSKDARLLARFREEVREAMAAQNTEDLARDLEAEQEPAIVPPVEA